MAGTQLAINSATFIVNPRTECIDWWQPIDYLYRGNRSCSQPPERKLPPCVYLVHGIIVDLVAVAFSALVARPAIAAIMPHSPRDRRRGLRPEGQRVAHCGFTSAMPLVPSLRCPSLSAALVSNLSPAPWVPRGLLPHSHLRSHQVDIPVHAKCRYCSLKLMRTPISLAER